MPVKQPGYRSVSRGNLSLTESGHMDVYLHQSVTRRASPWPLTANPGAHAAMTLVRVACGA